MRVVVKIGSSSLTNVDGEINHGAVAKLSAEVADLLRLGHQVVIVTSAAISAGLAPLGYSLADRPREAEVLRAASAVGQIVLMATYRGHLASKGLVAGQVLLAPTDLWHRKRYLKSRGTLDTLMGRGLVPVVNENDAVADDEISFGDNDRLAALVAHLIDADRLVLLTDTPGLFTSDPRRDANASLIEEIQEVDKQLEKIAGGPGSGIGSGGMASKLAAAKMASWSGVETVIASADRPLVLIDAVAGTKGIGTRFLARDQRLAARKLWIAFATPSSGTIVVDEGACQAVLERNKSLLPAGITDVQSDFDAEAAVELVGPNGDVFAKGLSRWPSKEIVAYAGDQTNAIPEDLSDEVVHRDDLVLLP